MCFVPLLLYHKSVISLAFASDTSLRYFASQLSKNKFFVLYMLQARLNINWCLPLDVDLALAFIIYFIRLFTSVLRVQQYKYRSMEYSSKLVVQW